MSVTVGMSWNLCGWRTCNAVRKRYPIQRSAQSQVAKEHVMGKYKHDLKFICRTRQNMWPDVQTSIAFADLFDRCLSRARSGRVRMVSHPYLTGLGKSSS